MDVDAEGGTVVMPACECGVGRACGSVVGGGGGGGGGGPS